MLAVAPFLIWIRVSPTPAIDISFTLTGYSKGAFVLVGVGVVVAIMALARNRPSVTSVLLLALLYAIVGIRVADGLVHRTTSEIAPPHLGTGVYVASVGWVLSLAACWVGRQSRRRTSSTFLRDATPFS
jgi:hypothetical protein